jgi:preprotein translocase subunit SecG
MYLVFIVLTVLVCVLLGIIVLIQNPKGGGLTSNFSSQSQLMGVQKTGDFLEKGTWILAIALMVLSLIINVSAKTGSSTQNSDMNKVNKTQPVQSAPSALPTAPKSK